jgi:Mg2+-importing ATPase
MQSSNNFWQFDASYWFDRLKSSENGLTNDQAIAVLTNKKGTKRVKSRFEKDLLLFLGQFKSPLMLLLIGAVILSAFLGDTSDVIIILFIVLSTGTLSFFQERGASLVVEKLQSMITLKCTVLRNSASIEIPSSQIVEGDILLFHAGDMIPADCLLIESNELQTNEASLTGESFPVPKEIGVLKAETVLAQRKNCLWEGTSIISGSGKGLVIASGEETVFGSIAKSADSRSLSAFEKGIKDFGYFLMKITLVLSVFILIVNLLNHKTLIDSGLFALALAVGMAPELLPAITTIAMSAGAKRMLQKKVIVKKLPSIQNLGEVNLLCTDKTGTITEGAIQIYGTVNGDGTHDDFVKSLAIWNATFESGYANPIDDALRKLSPEFVGNVQKTGEVPYDFIRKRLSIAVDTGTEKLLISKGAFTQIIGTCSFIRQSDGNVEPLESAKAEVEKQYAVLGEKGLRAIGMCYKSFGSGKPNKEDEKEMIFAGFVLLQDPVKPEIKETILELEKLSIGLKIITGDNRNVARSIAIQLGIQNPVILTGEEVVSLPATTLKDRAKETHIFAEVEPLQKEQIILALRQSFTVAYMGDGINDVAAINAADVAREAADFVLLEKNLMVLVEGIREGRKTFSNTMKYIFINTGSTFGNMLSVAAASLLLPFLPMLPKQILLTNFITDFPYLTVASDNVDEEQLAKPGKWDLKFIRNYMLIFGIHSSLFDMITFSTLLFVFKVKESSFQSSWFVESVMTQLFILFVLRTHKNFFKSKPGKYLFLLSIIGLIVTLVLPYTSISTAIGLVPLPWKQLLAMFAIVFLYIFTADVLKVWFFKKYRS